MEEKEQDCFEEIPIFGTSGKESAKPEVGAFDFVDVDGGEIPLAGSGDVETQTEVES